MAEIPEKIDISYISKINPPVAAAAEVARQFNKLVDYLKSIEPKLLALPDFNNPVSELVEQKLGPPPDKDDELRRFYKT